MGAQETKNPELRFEDEMLLDDLKAAAGALEHASNLPPLQLTQQADVAERMVVHARDNLIHRLREDGDAAAAAQWHRTLDQLNVVLSLIMAVEYPLGAMQRQPAEQAHDLLKRLVEQGVR